MTSTELPLTGMRVLVTRPAEQAAPLAAALRAAGADPILYPTIRIAPLDSPEVVEQALRSSRHAWAIFTSPVAVRYTVTPAAASALAACRIAAVGSETANALAAAGLAVEIVPEDESQEGLVAALSGLAAGTRILFPQALGGRNLLAAELNARGCIVDVVPVYQTLPLAHPVPPPSFDAATFASPSALRAFVESVGTQTLRSAVITVIGPTTAATAATLGVRVDARAARPNAQALVDALIAYRASTRKGAP